MNKQEIIKQKYSEAVSGINEQWLSSENTGWFDYISRLSEPIKISYLIVVFNNQVINGGFHQYFVNGYGQFSKETIDALKVIGANRKADLLSDAFALVNKENMTDDVFRKELLSKRLVNLFSNDDLFEPLDNLDSMYYRDKDEDIEELLGTYLLNQQITK